MMQYRKMKGTGIKVSEICLGTMTFGGQTDENESLKILDYAIENGINFIDTADAYNDGESEKIVGKGIKNLREKLIIATKVRFKSGTEINNYGLNRRHILKQIDKSLKNLNTDYIDLYYLHAMDNNTNIEETMDTMTFLVRSGKVRYIGISNYPAWKICEIYWKSELKNYIFPIVTQNMYNLITREVEKELIPFIKEYKIGMTIYNPIAGGLLTGKYKYNGYIKNTRFTLKPNYKERYWNKDNFNAVDDLTDLAQKNSMSLLELSMKWCLSHEFVDSAISGVSKLKQLEENIAAVNGKKLDDFVLAKCDEIWLKYNKNNPSYFKG
ncbi:MAG: aldo/keto reductase [Clostridiales bacterium]